MEAVSKDVSFLESGAMVVKYLVYCLREVRLVKIVAGVSGSGWDVEGFVDNF